MWSETTCFLLKFSRGFWFRSNRTIILKPKRLRISNCNAQPLATAIQICSVFSWDDEQKKTFELKINRNSNSNKFTISPTACGRGVLRWTGAEELFNVNKMCSNSMSRSSCRRTNKRFFCAFNAVERSPECTYGICNIANSSGEENRNVSSKKFDESFSRTSSPLIISICSETKVNKIYDRILYRLPFIADVVWIVDISLTRITQIVDCVASLPNWISANTMTD